MRTCEVCLEKKSIKDFREKLENRDGIDKWCSICRRAYITDWSRKKRLKRRLSAESNYSKRGGHRPKRIILPKPPKEPVEAKPIVETKPPEIVWTVNHTISFD